MMAHHLNVGIAGFCGVRDSRLDVLYNTFAAGVDDPVRHIAALRDQARGIAESLATDVGRGNAR